MEGGGGWSEGSASRAAASPGGMASAAAASRGSPAVRPLVKPILPSASTTTSGGGAGGGGGGGSSGTGRGGKSVAASAGGGSSSSSSGSKGRPVDPRGACLAAALRKVRLRRVAAAFHAWRGSGVAAERAQFAAFQALVEARSRRICVRYGRDKLYALLAARTAAQVRLAFERWRSAAIVDHARAVLVRSRLQVQVALDQTRAERGVYERAELAAARDRRAVMLQYAFLRWRDMAALAPLVSHLTRTAADLRDLEARAVRLQAAGEACRAGTEKAIAAARDEGATFTHGLVGELAAAAAAAGAAAR